MSETKLKIKDAKLEKGEIVTVKGNLGFARYLTRILEGEELAKVCEKREYATEVPHYEGTITDAKVICKTKGQPTDAEKVIAGRIYLSGEEQIKTLSIEKKIGESRKGKILFGVRRADGIHEVDLTGKPLASGQPVEVTFATREYTYKGKQALSLFLDTVVFENEPELYKPTLREGWVSDGEPKTDEQPVTEEPDPAEGAPEASAAGVWE